MARFLFLLVVFLSCISLIQGYLASISEDPRRNRILCSAAGETAYLYEIDSVERYQRNAHPVNVPSGTTHFSTYVHGDRILYQMLSEYNGTYLRTYSLPLNVDGPSLRPRTETFVGAARNAVPPVYDGIDNYALTIIGRNLTLVGLRSLKVMDSIQVLEGSRKIASSVVYNSKKNRATVFVTKVKSTSQGAVYNLMTMEYRIRKNKLIPYNTTFKNIDPVSGMFARSVLSAGGMDYSTNRIWALDTPNQRLVSFKANNLSSAPDFVSLPSNASFFGYSNNVAYDFDTRRAYVVSDIFDGFVVHAVDLRTSRVQVSHEYKTTRPATTVHLDQLKQNLYVGLQGDEFDWSIPDQYPRRAARQSPSILAIVSVESFSLDTIPLTPA